MAWVRVTAPDGREIEVTPEFLDSVVTEISRQFKTLSLNEMSAYARAFKMSPMQIIRVVQEVQRCRK